MEHSVNDPLSVSHRTVLLSNTMTVRLQPKHGLVGMVPRPRLCWRQVTSPPRNSLPIRGSAASRNSARVMAKGEHDGSGLNASMAYGSLTFLVLVLVFWILLSTIKRHSANMRALHEPLLGEPTMYRLDAAVREAAQGFNTCSLCGFENFKRIPFCIVCGGTVSESRNRQTTDPAASFEREVLSHRQRRARKRKEWIRMTDADSRLFWLHEPVEDDQQVGFVLRFRPLAVSSRPCAPFEDDDDENDSIQIVTHQRSSDAAFDSTEAQQSRRTDSITSLLQYFQMPLLSTTVPSPVLPTREVQALNLLYEAQITAMMVVEASSADPTTFPIYQLRSSSLNAFQISQQADRDFPSKHAQFVTAATALLVPPEQERITLHVERGNVWEESIGSIAIVPEAMVRSAMRIDFVKESGIDAGGLQREWFMLMNEALIEPGNAVFTCVDDAEQSFYLNRHSQHALGDEHLLYFMGAGRIIGRALLEGSALGFHLALPLLKIILSIPVVFSDLEFYDPVVYRNMVWIMEHDGIEALGLDFTVTEKVGNQVVVVDLIPNGLDVNVTDDNKHQYLERKFQYLLFESVSSQLYVFLKGLYQIVPQDLLMMFDPEEFAYLLSGSDEIDVDDWERHTRNIVYDPLEDQAHLERYPTRRWFWEIVREMPNEYRRRLLQFATGSSRVPLAGFGALTSSDGKLCPFTLKGVKLVGDGFITSHACFNRLDLPLHVVRRELQAVLYAVLETEAYGFTMD